MSYAALHEFRGDCDTGCGVFPLHRLHGNQDQYPNISCEGDDPMLAYGCICISKRQASGGVSETVQIEEVRERERMRIEGREGERDNIKKIYIYKNSLNKLCSKPPKDNITTLHLCQT